MSFLTNSISCANSETNFCHVNTYLFSYSPIHVNVCDLPWSRGLSYCSLQCPLFQNAVLAQVSVLRTVSLRIFFSTVNRVCSLCVWVDFFCIVWIFYCMVKKNDCKSLKMLNFSFKYFTRKTLPRYIFFSWVPWWASQKEDAMYIVLQTRTFKFHRTHRDGPPCSKWNPHIFLCHISTQGPASSLQTKNELLRNPKVRMKDNVSWILFVCTGGSDL